MTTGPHSLSNRTRAIPTRASRCWTTPSSSCRLFSATRRAAGQRHALGRRAGVVRRRPLPAGSRHPEQPHPALGRGRRQRQRVPPPVEPRQRPRARPPGPAAVLRAPDAARHAHRVRRQHHRARRPLRRQAPELAQRHRLRSATAPSGSPIRRSASSDCGKAIRPRANCRDAVYRIDPDDGSAARRSSPTWRRPTAWPSRPTSRCSTWSRAAPSRTG